MDNEKVSLNLPGKIYSVNLTLLEITEVIRTAGWRVLLPFAAVFQYFWGHDTIVSFILGYFTILAVFIYLPTMVIRWVILKIQQYLQEMFAINVRRNRDSELLRHAKENHLGEENYVQPQSFQQQSQLINPADDPTHKTPPLNHVGLTQEDYDNHFNDFPGYTDEDMDFMNDWAKEADQNQNSQHH